MPRRPCLQCGALTTGTYCPVCNPRSAAGHWTANRDRATQARFRRLVLQAAGGRCQYVANGRRCTTTNGLQAHHTQPGNDNPATGIALCRPHHRTIDKHAR
jgi:hypothetical protein